MTGLLATATGNVFKGAYSTRRGLLKAPALVRANCAAELALGARPEDATLGAPMPNPTGWRVRLNRTLVSKSLRHHLARLLLALDFEAVFARLLERLRAPAALERTRPQRTAPRKKKVRLAEFHMAYKAT